MSGTKSSSSAVIVPNLRPGRLGSDSPPPRPAKTAVTQALVGAPKAPANTSSGQKRKRAGSANSNSSTDLSSSSDEEDEEEEVRLKKKTPAEKAAEKAIEKPAEKPAAASSNFLAKLDYLEGELCLKLTRVVQDSKCKELKNLFDFLHQSARQMTTLTTNDKMLEAAFVQVENQARLLEQHAEGLPSVEAAAAAPPAAMEVEKEVEEISSLPPPPAKATPAEPSPKKSKAAPKVPSASSSETSEEEDVVEIPKEVTAKSLGLTDSQEKDETIQLHLGMCKSALKDFVEKKGSATKNATRFGTAVRNLKKRLAVLEARKQEKAAAQAASSSSSSSAPPQPPRAKLAHLDLDAMRALKACGATPFASMTQAEADRIEKAFETCLQASGIAFERLGVKAATPDQFAEFLEGWTATRFAPLAHFSAESARIRSQSSGKNTWTVCEETCAKFPPVRKEALRKSDVVFRAFLMPEAPKS